MPRRSERARLKNEPKFHKLKKKTVENKRQNMEKVRDLCDQYQTIFVFEVENYRNNLMKDLKEELSPSRFFQGKVKPTMISLGRNENEDYKPNLHKLMNCYNIVAKGSQKGLYFTNTDINSTIKFFSNYTIETYAKTGFVSTKDFIVKKGPLNKFVHSQEMQLRLLGLPVVLKHGKLILTNNYQICKIGQPLKPEQCKLLELYNIKLAKFKIKLIGYWNKNTFKQLVNNNNNNNKQTNNKHTNDIINNDNSNNINDNEKAKINRSSNFFENMLNNDFSSEFLNDNDITNDNFSENTNDDDNVDTNFFLNDSDDSGDGDDDVKMKI